MIAKLIRTISFYTLSFIIIAMCSVPIMISALLPVRYRFNPMYCFLLYCIYKVMSFSLLLPITIKGKEHLASGPMIYAANHQSALDIPLVGSLIGLKPHVWFLKYEFTKLPFVGWVAKRVGVSVDYRSPRFAVKSLKQGIRLLAGQDRSLAIFPEGGRFVDGTVHDFLGGFAIIAKKIKRPVIPIFLCDVRRVYPPGSFFINKYPITIIIGKPFEFLPDEDEQAFVNRVYRWFQAKQAECT